MKSSLYAGVLVLTWIAATSACTSILGGFDYNGKGGAPTTGTGGTGGTGGGTGGTTACMPCAAASNCPTPVSDCAQASCDNGCCSESPLALDTTCNTNGGKVCDGKGKCAECVVAAECPTPTTACLTRTCTNGVCGTSNAAAGATCDDNGGKVCDGNGKCGTCTQVSDCPDPGTACAARACVNGACTPTNAAAGTMCTDNSGAVCDGSGKCVACVKDGDCTATGTSCASVKCSATNTCDVTDAALGTTCNDHGGTVCDGSGKCVSTHCTDDTLDGDETDKDCGGSCKPCPVDDHCKLPGDCATGFCVGSPTGLCSTCSKDLDCASGSYCDTANNGGTCTPKKAGGKPCSNATQCATGFCADGVCCDGTCTGTCMGCVQAHTGKADGTCSAFSTGTPAPSGQCATSSSLPCGNDGRCGMNGACEQATSGTGCGTTCAGGMLTNNACDGAGHCKAGTGTACPGSLECQDGTSCLSTCQVDTDCASGYWCSSGSCVPQGMPGTGATCSAPNQCTSGYCVGGYCCDTACNGTCQTCGGGTCGNAPAGTDCTHACSAGTQTTSSCTSTGTCATGGTKACAPYVCGSLACKTSCASHADCVAGDFCWPTSTCVKATAVSAGPGPGAYDVCALTSGGVVQCWGYGNTGEMGNGTALGTSTPVGVSNLSGISAIATGDNHSCALTTAGALQCWGSNAKGQLGSTTTAMCGGTPCSNVPIAVPGFSSGVTSVGLGTAHSCAVKSGGVWCWGSNGEGQLGNGTQTDSTTPVQVTGLTSGVAAVAAGEYHTCALTTAGAVQCWGWNSSGQAGAQPPYFLTTPQTVISSGVAAITLGAEHTCALTTAGAVKCWGRNDDGMLGNNSTTLSATPVQVTGLTSGVVAVEAGYYHTCAVTSAGAVMCWGLNRYGELGNTSSSMCTLGSIMAPCSLVPVTVAGLGSGVAATAVAAGYEDTCALTSAGPQCWGLGTSGQLGNGSTTTSATPVLVAEP